MSFPSLSEQATIARFGIHDVEVLAEMEEHADDVIPCMYCDEVAGWRFSMRCCGDSAFLCDPDAVEVRQNTKQIIASCVLRPTCFECGHRFPLRSTYDDIVREVPL